MTPFVTKSEQMFADYLNGANLEWTYEPQIPGHSKIPDFVVTTESGEQILVDVKERNVPFAESDPIKDARHLMKKGLEKFKDYGEHLCAVVLYENSVTSFDEFTLFSAMFGDPGVEFGINFDAEAEIAVDQDSSDDVRGVFLQRGGKLIQHYPRMTNGEAVPHESGTNLRAVIALRFYDIPNPAFAKAWQEAKERLIVELGRPLTTNEEVSAGLRIKWERELPLHLGSSVGLIVCMNPFAKFAFPDTVFNGPYDERWSIVDGAMAQTFVGAKRLALYVPGCQDDSR